MTKKTHFFTDNKFSLPLFLLICCAIWTGIVMLLGVYDSSIIPKPGVFPYTFNWWENTNFPDHLFLGNYVENESLKGTVYTTYTYPYYFINYLILAPLHFGMGIPYEIAQNILPYINALFFAFLMYRIKEKEIKHFWNTQNPYFLVYIFLGLGLIITNALPWISMLKNNLDNFHLFISLIFCLLSLTTVTSFETLKRDQLFLYAGLIIACISPIYFPAWFICYIYSEEKLVFRKKMLKSTLMVAGVHLLNYLLPLWAAQHLGLRSSASPFLYRTGLDGSRTYFDSILSVIYHPFSSQQTISTALLLISTIVLGIVLKTQNKGYFKQALFLLIPFLSVVILFPQFSTIHMYFVELLLVIPCIFMLCFYLFNFQLISNLNPRQYTFVLLFVGFIIMSQLLEISAHFLLAETIKSLL